LATHLSGGDIAAIGYEHVGAVPSASACIFNPPALGESFARIHFGWTGHAVIIVIEIGNPGHAVDAGGLYRWNRWWDVIVRVNIQILLSQIDNPTVGNHHGQSLVDGLTQFGITLPDSHRIHLLLQTLSHQTGTLCFVTPGSLQSRQVVLFKLILLIGRTQHPRCAKIPKS